MKLKLLLSSPDNHQDALEQPYDQTALLELLGGHCSNTCFTASLRRTMCVSNVCESEAGHCYKRMYSTWEHELHLLGNLFHRLKGKNGTLHVQYTRFLFHCT